MSTEMICYIIALPIITLFVGIMIGGAEARKEQNRKNA